MIGRIMALAQRVELLLIVACAWALAISMPRQAHADGESCVDACVAAFGISFTSNGRYYLLADCGSSELGSGRVWCMYVGRAL